MHGDIPPQILQRYGLQPVSSRLLKAESDGRAVWRIEDHGGTYALKRFHKANRAVTAAQVSRHLAERNIALAPVIPTADGSLWAVDGDRYYALFGWVEGVHPPYDAPGMIDAIAELLARFHAASAGYARKAQRVASLLNWQSWYQKQAGHLRRLQALAGDADDALSALMRSHGSWLHRRVEWTMAQLQQPKFGEVVRQARKERLLGHMDYSRDNLLLTPEGQLVIIDLDTAAMSLPIWDVTRLITWIDHDWQTWSPGRMEQVLAAYARIRPISPLEREMLLVDQVFPRQAIAIARGWFDGPRRCSLPEEFARCLRTDQARLNYLGIGPVEKGEPPWQD